MANIAKKHELSERDTNRIIEMAWEDRTPFDAIEAQFGLPESEVIVLMRQQMKPSSWRMWRARVRDEAPSTSTNGIWTKVASRVISSAVSPTTTSASGNC